eukprot:11437884-Ditylum_brightwellii.AAC.1
MDLGDAKKSPHDACLLPCDDLVDLVHKNMLCRECVLEDGKSSIKEVGVKLKELIPWEYHHHITSTVVHHGAKPFGKISSTLHHIGCSSSLEAECTKGRVICCNRKMRSRKGGKQLKKQA